MGKSWGINTRIAIWMHKTVLLPRTMYASMVLCPIMSKVEAKNLLKSLQGSYLRATVWSMKTTPRGIESMHLLNSPGPVSQ
jgi:hypothetical protein